MHPASPLLHDAIAVRQGHSCFGPLICKRAAPQMGTDVMNPLNIAPGANRSREPGRSD